MDYFMLPGVEVTATPEEIKQAYRRKAAERFHEIAEAYAVLIDENRREQWRCVQPQFAAVVADPVPA
jgi:curved DNA-binding protein CbpA